MDLKSDITVLRGLSKRILAVQVFDDFYVNQLVSVSRTLIKEV